MRNEWHQLNILIIYSFRALLHSDVAEINAERSLIGVICVLWINLNKARMKVSLQRARIICGVSPGVQIATSLGHIVIQIHFLFLWPFFCLHTQTFFFVVEFDLIHKNTAAPTAMRSHSLSTWMCWGPAADLAVGVSCLAIPRAGGVRPLWVSLGQLHAECCSEPLQKHLGYLLPSKQSFPYGSVTSFSNFPFLGSGGFVLLSQGLWFQCQSISVHPVIPRPLQSFFIMNAKAWVEYDLN